MATIIFEKFYILYRLNVANIFVQVIGKQQIASFNR